MRRGRARRGRQVGDAAGDPLDGLVNLFDVGIVLAIAFLVAGLASSVNRQTQKLERRTPTPSRSAPAHGRGTAVGTVYKLADGRLIYTAPKGGARP